MSQVEKRRMCPNCRAFITTDDKVCPYCEMKLGPKAIERRNPAGALGGMIPHARFTTVMILLINTGLFAATFFAPNGTILLDFGAKDRFAIVVRGEWWRLITAGFLHGGLVHILMNSWLLFDLGTQVEETFGTSRYLVLYFVSTVTGFWASTLWRTGVSIGASAGIFGLIGAMIAHGVRERSAYGAAVRSMYVRWAVYGLLMGLLIPFIDNAAHIGGLAGGFVIAYIAGTPGYSEGVERAWKVAAGIALGMTAAAFSQMFYWLTRAR